MDRYSGSSSVVDGTWSATTNPDAAVDKTYSYCIAREDSCIGIAIETY